VAVVLAALLMALAATARAGSAPLRWRFEGVRGYVYRLAGDKRARDVFDGDRERTLYAADLADGRALACPPEGVEGVVLATAFRLPKDAVAPHAKWTIREAYPGHAASAGTPRPAFAVEGGGQCVADKGATIELRQSVEVRPAVVEQVVMDRVTVAVDSTFDVEKAAVTSAAFTVSWAAGGGVPAGSYEGKIELARPLLLDTGPLARDAAEAVSRGAATLREALAREDNYGQDQSPLGMLSLVLLALERAGDDPDLPHMKAGFAALRKLVAENDHISSNEDSTYAVSLAILAIEGRAVKRAAAASGSTEIRYEKGELDKADLALLEKLTGWLLAGKNGAGGWSYQSPAGSGGGGGGGRRRRGGFGRGGGDLSNTQFAILALHAASRAGVRLPPKALGEIAAGLLALQAPAEPSGNVALAIDWEPDAPLAERTGRTALRAKSRPARGFGYVLPKSAPGDAYTSMSAAGVSSLVICREELEKVRALDAELGKRLLDAVFDGLGWLQVHHTMRENWGARRDWSHYYCLYSLEKAFEIGKVAALGGHDWWSEGATELLAREKRPKDGGADATGTGRWGGDESDAAFAILFLTRASSEPEIHVREAGREASGAAAGDGDAVSVPGVGVVSAREVFGATEAASPDRRRDRIALAEKVFEATPLEARPRLAPPLGRLLGSKYPDVAKLAARLLAAAAGGKVADEKAAEAFFGRWDEAQRLGVAGDSAATPRLEELLHDPLFAVRRAAALGLSRLGAIEAVPDLIRELGADDKDYRGYIRAILAPMIGVDPGFDDAKREASVARWQAAWDERKDALFERAALRADVEALGRPEAREAARARLVAKGKPAVRALIEALARDALRGQAALALEEITGQKLGAEKDAWERWWAAEGGK
jgi:hypothetical protein